MKLKQSWVQRITQFCSSSLFFKLIIGIFVFQAAWIACTSRYPMAFDEDFHLGIIKLYAHHISPFWSGQSGPATFGAFSRDPSYLYQYLMSFPYRLLSICTHNQTTIVLVLRALNIAMFASALPLFKRLLHKTGAPKSVIHIAILLFVLLPVVPLLAAQINYDNLIMPLTALVLLISLDVRDQLRIQQVPLIRLIQLIILCLFTSLVKYAFLPIILAVVIYLLVCWWQSYHGSGQTFRDAIKAYHSISKRTKCALLLVFVLVFGLFIERYGVNAIRYHTPIPNCRKVLTIEQCKAYGPWSRDYNLALNKNQASISHSLLTFTWDWLYGMWLRTMFAVAGPTNDFQTRTPLAVPGITVIGVAILAAIATIGLIRRLVRKYDASTILFFLGVSGVYLAVLFLDEYKAFIRTGQPVAINGRYLFPVLLLLMVIGGLAIYEMIRRFRRSMIIGTVVVVLGMSWGGGALTYILRSNDSWYWHEQPIFDITHIVQHTLGPITPGYKQPTTFL